MNRTMCLIGLIFFLVLHSCANTKQVDLIFHNGTIYTVDESFSTAEAMALKDGMILAVGNDDAIIDRYKAEQIVDLDGGFVYPGLIDAHCHFVGYGMSLQNADLTGTVSFEEIIEVLKEHQAKHPSEWILGRGWDQNDWENKQFPTKDKLDLAFPGKPVLLTRIDGHGAIASSEALRRANVTEETSIDGGALIKKDGKLTGVLIDNAIGLVRKVLPKAGRQDYVNALIQGQKNCFAVGITSLHEAGTGYATIGLIDSLQMAGELKMRIYAMLSPGKKNYEHYLFKGIHKTDRLNVRSIKLFADGALGSRGALLFESYSDDPGNVGLAVNTDEFIREQCRLAHEHGYQVNTHCIGDSANRWILDIYSDFLTGKNDSRWRIEHSQVIHLDDFSKFGEYSIIPSVQSTHATSDMYWAEDRVGPVRIKGAYAYRQLLHENGWLPNGSDFPVEHINPLYGYYALFARKDHEGWPEGGYQMEQALTREEAIRAMTIWAARSAFEEDEKGSLEPGKLADFIITGEDLLTIPEQDIPGLMIRQTYIGGEMVYTRKDL
ncbi:MAG: amidohydrolase [Bacteroidales bacterium]|nr:amidohydrolase [Bacteroidales bacterium]